MRIDNSFTSWAFYLIFCLMVLPLHSGLLHFSLDTYLILLSVKQEVLSTIFKVFGMTRPGIEPSSPEPLVNTLLCRLPNSTRNTRRRPKHCEHNNKNENNISKTLNDENITSATSFSFYVSTKSTWCNIYVSHSCHLHKNNMEEEKREFEMHLWLLRSF